MKTMVEILFEEVEITLASKLVTELINNSKLISISVDEFDLFNLIEKKK